MVRIYTSHVRLEEPVESLFRCEFCEYEFKREGKITVDEKIETWYREINESDVAVAVDKAKAKILKVHELIETGLDGGMFYQKWSENQSSLHFDGGAKCPNCEYEQQIKEKRPIETKTKVKLGIFLLMPIAIYVTIIYASIISFLDHNSLSSLSIAILMIALIPTAYFLLKRTKHHNDAFMKKHALSKKDLPAPRKPILSFGTAKVVKG